MRLRCAGAPHLTYCTNIHPGETWPEVRANLKEHVIAVRDRVADGARFGVGLRLSARAAEALAAPAALEELRDLLDRNHLYVFTLNGFPYGPFHGAPVKERVYLPDWLDDERLAYTDRLAALLTALLPDEDGLEGSVSTVPGAFKPRVRGAGDAEAMARRLIRHAAALVDLRRRTGKRVALALEPEPRCFLETTAETVAFFEAHVFSRPRVAELAALAGLAPAAAEQALRDHLGVCFDACHMAVEFEDAPTSLAALAAAGIPVHKVQISAGLRARMDALDPGGLERLRAYAEGVYLHQVVARRGASGELTRYTDLPEALAAWTGAAPDPRALSGAAPGPTTPSGDPLEWRVHFHVPIFRELTGPITTTQPELRDLLAHLRHAPATRHLEVETYTWDVLPEEHRREGVAEAVARELRWVMERMEP